MNRIFKIIWSQTRQTYVVVSELVKRGGWRLLSTTQKLALGMAVAGLLAAPGMAEPNEALSSDNRVVRVITVSESEGHMGIESPFIQIVGVQSATTNEYASATGTHAVAIGAGARATLPDSIALGSGSVADRAKYNATNNAYKAYLNEDDSKTNSAWRATHNAIAVGSDDASNPVTRQITGVAAGTYDTDAVNVAQLKAATVDLVNIQGITRVNNKTTIEKGFTVQTNFNSGSSNGYMNVYWGQDTQANGENATAWGNSTAARSPRSTAWGNEATAKGDQATAFGSRTTAYGVNSTAWGADTVAFSHQATAFGENTTAGGQRATAWGHKTTAGGDSSTAYGKETSALMEGATAWGNNTKAGRWTYTDDNGVVHDALVIEPDTDVNNGSEMYIIVDAITGEQITNGKNDYIAAYDWLAEHGTVNGVYSTAWGNGTQAAGDYSTAFGNYTKTAAVTSLKYNGTEAKVVSKQVEVKDANGNTIMITDENHPEWGSIPKTETKYAIVDAANPDNQIYESYFDTEEAAMKELVLNGTITGGYGATAFGLLSEAKGAHSTAFGVGTTARGTGATAFGFKTIANGDNATAFGSGTTASDMNATAFGSRTIANGDNATAFGADTTAKGKSSTAFGSGTTASGVYSTAFGEGTLADGSHSTAWGDYTQALSHKSTAFGDHTTAGHDNATAWGYETTAGDRTTTAFGVNTAALMEGATAWGHNTKAGKWTVKDDTGKVHDLIIETYTDNNPAEGERELWGVKYAENKGTDDVFIGGQNSYTGAYEALKEFAPTDPNVTITMQGNYATAWGNGTEAEGDYSTAFGNFTKTAAVTSFKYNGTEAKVVSEVVVVKDADGNPVTITDPGNPESGETIYETEIKYTIVNADNPGEKLSDTYFDSEDAAMNEIVQNGTITGGYGATAFGLLTEAKGAHSTAFGVRTTAEGTGATAWGNSTTASGKGATASGYGTKAEGDYSTAFGNNTTTAAVTSLKYRDPDNNDWTEAKIITKNTDTGLKYVIVEAADPNKVLYFSDFDTEEAAMNEIAQNGTITGGYGATAFGLQSEAKGAHSTAFGVQTVAEGTGATAWGRYAKATGDYSTAWGFNTEAINDKSTAFGDNTIAGGKIATAWGYKTAAGGRTSTAFGSETAALTEGATAWGNNTKAGKWTYAGHDVFIKKEGDGHYHIIDEYGNSGSNGLPGQTFVSYDAAYEYISSQGTVKGVYATAWGKDTKAEGDYSTAFGVRTVAEGTGATAWGIGTEDEMVTASGIGATAFGNKTVASGDYSTAFGVESKAYGQNSLAALGGIVGAEGDTAGVAAVAVGDGAQAVKSYTYAIGRSAIASEDNTIAIGNGAEATSADSIAFGNGSKVSGKNSIAIGANHTVSGSNSGAFGDPAIINGSNSYSVGNNNTVPYDNVFVLGNNVTNVISNSVFLGSGASFIPNGNKSASSADNYTSTTIGGVSYNFAGGDKVAGVVAVGSGDTHTRRIQGVAPGLVGSDSTDAINGSQLYAAISHGVLETDNRAVRLLKDQTTGRQVISSPFIHINGVAGAAETNYAHATGTNSIAIGYQASATSPDAIAIGVGAKAEGEDSIAIGEGAVAEGEGAIVLGRGGSEATGREAMAWGNTTLAEGELSTAWGYTAQATGTYSTAWGEGAEASGDYATAWGYQTVAGGEAATAWGDWTEANGTDSTAWGSGAIANGWSATAWGTDTVANGDSATAFGSYSIASGDNSTAFGQETITLGAASTALGYQSATTGAVSVALGWGSKAYGKNSFAALGGITGEGSIEEDDDGNIVATVTKDAQGAVAIGEGALAQESYTYAIGQNARATAENALALGNGTSVTKAGGVALGVSSDATTAAGVRGYDPATGTTSTQESHVWQSTLGAVAIGSADKGLTRQITGVAAGTNDTDAANVAQLKALSRDTMVAVSGPGVSVTSDDPAQHDGIRTWTISLSDDGTIGRYDPDDPSTVKNSYFVTGDTVYRYVSVDSYESPKYISKDYTTGQNLIELDKALKNSTVSTDMGWYVQASTSATSANIKPGDLLSLDQGSNMVITQDGKKLAFAVSDSPVFSGMVTANGFDANNQRIVNVASGEADTDAVNLGQLKSISRDTLIETAGTNITVTSDDPVNNVRTWTISISDDGQVAADSTSLITGQTVYNYVSVDSYESPTYISKDYTTGQNLIELDKAITQTAVSTDLGWYVQASTSATSANIKPGDLLSIDQGSNMVITQDGKKLTFAVSDSPVFSGMVTAQGFDASGDKIIHVAAGDISSDSTDAVNGSQLWATNQSVDLNAADIAIHAQSIDANASNIAVHAQSIDTNAGNIARNAADIATVSDDLSTLDGLVVKYDGASKDNVTLGGTESSEPVKLTNVKSGALSSDSTDAVNGSQLFAAGSSTASGIGGDTRFDAESGTVNVSLTLDETEYTSLYEALKAVNRKASSSDWELAVEDGDPLRVSSGTKVTLRTDGTDDNLTIVRDGSNVTFAIKDDPVFKGVVKAEGGFDANFNKVKNVAPGTIGSNSYDAVNGSQLYDLGESTRAMLGGTTVFDPDTGRVEKFEFNYHDGITYHDVTSALDAINTDMKSVSETFDMKGDTVTVKKKAVFNESVTVNKDMTVEGNFTAKGPASFYSGINMNGSRITGLAGGNVYEGSTNAVTGGEVYQLGRGVSDSLNEMNSRLTKDIRRTGSRAAALAGLHPLPYIPSKPTNFAAAIGSYRGDTAVAVGLSHYVNENTMFSVGSTIGHQPMVNLGVALRLGRGEEKLPTGRGEKAQNNRMARMEQNFESYKQEKEAEIAELRKRLDQIQGVPAAKKTTAQPATAPDSVDAKLEKLIERRRARKAAQTVKR